MNKIRTKVLVTRYKRGANVLGACVMVMQTLILSCLILSIVHLLYTQI